MGIDIQNAFVELQPHKFHEIEIVTYGDRDNPRNVAIECIDCCCVLLDFNRPGEDGCLPSTNDATGTNRPPQS